MGGVVDDTDEGFAVVGEGEGDAKVWEAVDEIDGSGDKRSVTMVTGDREEKRGGGYPSTGSQMKVGASVSPSPGTYVSSPRNL